MPKRERRRPSEDEAKALLKEIAAGLAEAEADTRWLPAGQRDQSATAQLPPIYDPALALNVGNRTVLQRSTGHTALQLFHSERGQR